MRADAIYDEYPRESECERQQERDRTEGGDQDNGTPFVGKADEGAPYREGARPYPGDGLNMLEEDDLRYGHGRAEAGDKGDSRGDAAARAGGAVRELGRTGRWMTAPLRVLPMGLAGTGRRRHDAEIQVARRAQGPLVRDANGSGRRRERDHLSCLPARLGDALERRQPVVAG